MSKLLGITILLVIVIGIYFIVKYIKSSIGKEKKCMKIN